MRAVAVDGRTDVTRFGLNARRFLKSTRESLGAVDADLSDSPRVAGRTVYNPAAGLGGKKREVAEQMY